MAVKRHTLDIYGTEIVLATNKREWRKVHKDWSFVAKKTPNSAGLAHFATFHPNEPAVTSSHLAIWIDGAAMRNDLDLVETAAHEAAHGVAQIFDWIGHKIKGSDEPSAYLVGWLTRWIVEGVRGE